AVERGDFSVVLADDSARGNEKGFVNLGCVPGGKGFYECAGFGEVSIENRAFEPNGIVPEADVVSFGDHVAAALSPLGLEDIIYLAGQFFREGHKGLFGSQGGDDLPDVVTHGAEPGGEGVRDAGCVIERCDAEQVGGHFDVFATRFDDQGALAAQGADKQAKLENAIIARDSFRLVTASDSVVRGEDQEGEV